MPLKFTQHALARLRERGIGADECEAAVNNDKNPWRTKLKAGDHWRCFSNNVTVVTDLSKTLVVTAFKGEAGGWGPETEGL